MDSERDKARRQEKAERLVYRLLLAVLVLTILALLGEMFFLLHRLF